METDNSLISLKELALIEGGGDWQRAYATIRTRAARGKYITYKKIRGEGYIEITDPAIPDNIRLKIISDETVPITCAPAVYTKEVPECINSSNELSPKQEKIALARADLINLYMNFSDKEGDRSGIVNAKMRFISAYNNNAIPKLYNLLGNKKFRTIELWKQKYLEGNKDYRVLAPRYRKEKLQSVPPNQASVLITLALNPNRPKISAVINMAKDTFVMNNYTPLLNDKTYRRFLERWKSKNYPDWIFFREGEKALDDKVLPYIERDYNRIEVGDIVVADGHTLNFEIINPETGKPKRMTMVLFFDMKSSMPLGWEIAVSENTQAIAVALRRTVLLLGKYPKIIYIDNGRAFCSKLLNGGDFNTSGLIGIFERLGAKVINAIPYHAQSKTIERFFNTFAELERFMPTYSGTSIADKPPRLNRGEKTHVKIYEKMMKDVSVDIYTAHRAVAWFFDKYSTRVQKDGHLAGKTPIEIFQQGRGSGVDKKELNFLMMSLKARTISRNGVSLFGTNYYHRCLTDMLLEEVIIRYDLIETDSIFIYSEKGEFICEAFRRDKIHPAASILGSEEDKIMLENLLSQKAEIKRDIVGEAKKFLSEEVYPALNKQLKQADIIPIKSGDKTGKGRGRNKTCITDLWKLPENDKSKVIGE